MLPALQQGAQTQWALACLVASLQHHGCQHSCAQGKAAMCCLRAASAAAPSAGRPKAVGTTSRCRFLGRAGASWALAGPLLLAFAGLALLTCSR